MNMKRLETFAVLCLVAVVALAVPGCGPKAIPGKVGQPLELQEKVVGMEGWYARNVRVVAHKAERTDDGLLRVKIGLQNVDDDDTWADIRVQFRDADNFELEATNWQPLLLPGNQVTYYETVSLSPKAADYTIGLRNPRESVAK